MQEHPFAGFIRILGRGKKGSRSLTFDEAAEAMRMILAGEVEKEQLGAFLMLIRVKEESPEELAGFVHAARVSLRSVASELPVTIDWPCYAGKRRHLPWFILSALLLAGQGQRILLHGIRGNKDDRVYAEDAMRALGLPVCRQVDEAAEQLQRRRLAFMPLAALSPRLQEVVDLSHLLGLRSPVNTLLRMLNPASAPYMVQGIFHPGYLQIHQAAGLLLEEPHMIVFRGEGGEAERNPDAPCQVLSQHHGREEESHWPALFERRHSRPELLEVERLAALWRGDIDDEYGHAAVVATTALILRLLQPDKDMLTAEIEAESWWQERDRDILAG